VADAIETLMNEHRTILAVLDRLDRYAAEAERGEAEPALLADVVTFLREYADRHHHAKEEEILFVAMCEHGFSRDAGPVAVMLHEHELGRALVGELGRVADADGSWTEDQRAVVARAGREFADLLRAHIHKEDQVLYPMARARLPEEALDALEVRCRRVEDAAEAAGTLARYRAIAERLTAPR
jgi:hemerythrin-like domain-containing protein